MKMLWVIIIIIIFVPIIWYKMRLDRMSILEKYGIPGPKPHLVFGNIFKGVEGKDMIEKQKLLIEKFGKIVGYYTGARPIVLVADPELVKLIQVTDFQNFPDRSIYLKYQHPSHRADGTIFKACTQKWKQIRGILSPTFSASKLKSMTPLVNQSIDSLLKVIEKSSETDSEINIHELYLKLTAETIIKTCFGISADLQNDTNNEFMRAAKNYFEGKVNKVIFIVFTSFPELSRIINWMRGQFETLCTKCGLTPVGVFWKMSENFIRLRIESTGPKPKDLLQAMLETKVSSKDVNEMAYEKLTTIFDKTSNQVGNEDNRSKNYERKQISLTEDEIKSNCIVFFGAGYETSSTALAYVTHFLVNLPQIQERVRQEVQELYEREGELNYNTITGLPYMEWVFNETMRLYPPISVGTTRECLSDYKYRDMIIPKGAVVAMATYYLHYDPDFWSEPQKFDPLRFSPERRHEINPSSWQPFGDGPRNCIGLRFAFLLMKLTLAKLLLTYRFEKGPSTEIGSLATKCKLIAMTPKNGIFVKMRKL